METTTKIKNIKYIVGLDMSSTRCGFCVMEKYTKRIINSGYWDIQGEKFLFDKLELIARYLENFKKDSKFEETIFYIEEPLTYMSPKCIKPLMSIFGLTIGVLGIDKVKFVSSKKWREIIFHNCNQNKLGREGLKRLAIQEVLNKYQIECQTDDEAEAILIARYGTILE